MLQDTLQGEECTFVVMSYACEKALKPAKLALALKRPVMVPDFDTVYQEVRRLLYKRLRTCLSLGQQAGAVVSGYSATAASLCSGTCVVPDLGRGHCDWTS